MLGNPTLNDCNLYRSSNLYSASATSLDLLDQLSLLDSRTIYIEDNVSVLIGDWPTTIVVANYR